MREAGTREQGVWIRGLRITPCAVKGCVGFALNAEHCAHCARQIDELEAWRCGQEARALHGYLLWQERTERLRRFARWLWRVMWIPELLFVAAVLLYLGWEMGYAFLAWTGIQ